MTGGGHFLPCWLLGPSDLNAQSSQGSADINKSAYHGRRHLRGTSLILRQPSESVEDVAGLSEFNAFCNVYNDSAARILYNVG